MATITIHPGVNNELTVQNSLVILIGQGSSTVAFEEVQSKFAGFVSAETYETAKSLPTNCVSLYLNTAYLCKLPTRSSRHLNDSRPDILTKQIRSLPLSAETVSIVVRVSVSNALAYVIAIGRVFPLYNRKSDVRAHGPKNVSVEILVQDGEHLTANDVQHLSDACNSSRQAAMLGDMPACELHTDAFLQHALVVAKEVNADVKVIRGAELEAGGFGGLWGVGKAAEHPPALVVLSWQPAEAKQVVALVGKGIVYDTGGLSLKGKTAMPTMKGDMCGAAAVLHAFATLVRSGFSERLHCLLCLAENAIGPQAQRPDDIVKMLSGKTVEVNNTDAEGRLVLGDGVFYAKSVLKAEVIIDLATLTGAQATATGAIHAAVVCNRENWERACVAAGKHAGDLCHPLVYIPDICMGDLKSAVADMKNANMGKTRAPLTCIAAEFIHSQLEPDASLSWLHVDMAAPAKCKDTDRATGYGVALLVSLLGRYTRAANLCYGMGQQHF